MDAGLWPGFDYYGQRCYKHSPGTQGHALTLGVHIPRIGAEFAFVQPQ